MENDINTISSSNNTNIDESSKINFNSLHISEASTINSDTQNSKNSENKSSSSSIKSGLNKKKFHINLKTPKVNLSKLNIEKAPKNNIEEQKILKDKFNKVNESQISYDTCSIKYENKNIPKEKKKFKLSLYTLEKKCNLGSGASGDVYLVEDTQTHKKLALKTVKYTDEEKVEQQLGTKVKLSSLLKHENIIRYFATYFLEGTINFVMKYMDKGTLAVLIKRVKKNTRK